MQAGIKYWVCSKDGIAGHKCLAFNLKDTDIKKSFANLFNRVKQNEREIIDTTLAFLIQVKNKISSANSEIQEIDTEIALLSNQNNVFVKLKTKGIMDEISYIEQTADIQKRLTQLRNRRIKLLNADEDEHCIEQLRELKETINEIGGFLLEFDEDIFKKIVKNIYVLDDGNVVFELVCGLKLKEKARWD